MAGDLPSFRSSYPHQKTVSHVLTCTTSARRFCTRCSRSPGGVANCSPRKCSRFCQPSAWKPLASSSATNAARKVSSPTWQRPVRPSACCFGWCTTTQHANADAAAIVAASPRAAPLLPNVHAGPQNFCVHAAARLPPLVLQRLLRRLDYSGHRRWAADVCVPLGQLSRRPSRRQLG